MLRVCDAAKCDACCNALPAFYREKNPRVDLFVATALCKMFSLPIYYALQMQRVHEIAPALHHDLLSLGHAADHMRKAAIDIRNFAGDAACQIG